MYFVSSVVKLLFLLCVLRRPETKNPARGGVLYQAISGSLLGNDVARLRAFGAVFDVKGDLLAFGQGLEAVALNGAEVNEYIRTAVILSNETEAFGFVEPLYRTCSHDMCTFTN